MIKSALLTLPMVLVLAAPAMAKTSAKKISEATTLPTVATLMVTYTTSYCASENADCLAKVVAAKEDAAYYVASEGEIKTALLDEAFAAIRAENPQLEASDFELAILITQ